MSRKTDQTMEWFFDRVFPKLFIGMFVFLLLMFVGVLIVFLVAGVNIYQMLDTVDTSRGLKGIIEQIWGAPL